MICDFHYVRRCRECGFDSRFQLPELAKKIIYLDQMCLSNMMKALNPQTKAYQKGHVDSYWITIFEKLDSLCKSQVLLCPASSAHLNESLLSPFFKDLRQMYELLSYGTSFYDLDTIKRFQIAQHAGNWLSGMRDKPLKLDRKTVMHGRTDGWKDRMIISVNLSNDLSWVEDLRREREMIDDRLSHVFQRWQAEKNKTFEDWFEEEATSFGRAILETYESCVKTLNIFHPSVNIVHSIHNVFERAGLSNIEARLKAKEYLTSRALIEIPFIRLSSMLWAVMARKAAGGRKRPLGRGIANDIRVISVLLPYCDGMFVDRECHNFLEEKPIVNLTLEFGTRVFSVKNKNEFLEYLESIKTQVSQDHWRKLDEVYGKDWREPYTTLYKT